jgi:hypothetical protein
VGDILQDADDYQLVRDLLGLGSGEVSDALIESDVYLGYVEGEVEEAIADYASLTGVDLVLLKAGAAAWVAALIAARKSAAEGGGFRIGPYSENSTANEWADRTRDLMQQAAHALSSISTRTLTRPTLLVLAGPTRARSVPADFEAWLEKIQPRILDWLEEGGEDD